MSKLGWKYNIKYSKGTRDPYIEFKSSGELYIYDEMNLKAYLPYKLHKSTIYKLKNIGVIDIYVADYETEFIIEIKKLYDLDKILKLKRNKIVGIQKKLF